MNKQDYQKFFKLAIEKKYSKEELQDFKKAIKFHLKILEDEKREKHEINRNLKLTQHFLKSSFSKEVIIASLLHKIDKKVSQKILEKNFGKEISILIFEQKKIRNIEQKLNEFNYEPSIKLLISSIKDVRAFLIKLIFEINKLESLELLETPKARRALNFYAPLAEEIGLKKIKKILIDKSFKILNPKKYEEISKFLKESFAEREETIKKIIIYFENFLNKKIKKFKINGREKSIYSIHNKTENRKIPLNKQKDHYAIRIIVQNIKECYYVLYYLHEKFGEIPNSLKDYIKNPKQNGYQSLHTFIRLKEKLLEIQIRTNEMHRDAEKGSAAHWKYKNLKKDKKFEIKTSWLKEVLKLKENKKSEKLLKELKLNLFQEDIYCYTPKGEIIQLKKDSTVLDFAYKIHAEIGNKAIGGIINEKFSSLNSKLKNGDSLKIITNKFQRPRREWMKFVNSGFAKKMIAKKVKEYEKIPVPKKNSFFKKKENKSKIPILVQSLPNHEISLAKCCNPLPNKKIKAIVRSHKKILIHESNCKKILKSTKNQVPCYWKESFSELIKIDTEVENRAGILADILNTISRLNFKIIEANAKLIENGKAKCFFVLNPKEKINLKLIIERIKKINGVKKIRLE